MSSTPEVTRRGLLVGGMSVAVGVSLAPSDNKAEVVTNREWTGVVGTLISVTNDFDSFSLETKDGSACLLRLTVETEFWRDGRVTVQEFEIGDWLAATGSWWDTSELVAIRVEPVYRSLDFTVDWPFESPVETPDGLLAITPSAMQALKARLGSTPRRDVEFRANVRSDPARKVLVTAMLGPSGE